MDWGTEPVEPPPTGWGFPDPWDAPEDLVAIGADLEPGTLLAAYRAGYFPMPHGRRRVGWWSPNPRGIMPIGGMHITRSMRQSARRFTVTVDTDFRAVMLACGDPRRPHGWITPAFVDAYEALHRLGWTHSVEVRDDGLLVGGVYGVRIGRFFAGESMFHHRRDASKVALMALMDLLVAGGVELFDVQWATDHLRSLGVIEITRGDYLDRLARAVG